MAHNRSSGPVIGDKPGHLPSLADDPDRPNADLPSTLRLLARLIGLLVLAGAALVLLGWATGRPDITSLGPGLPAMVPSTALALAMLGAALWARQLRHPQALALPANIVAMLLATMTTILGALILGQHLVGWTLPLDTAFLSPGTYAPPSPGQPPFHTALNLTLLGVSLLLVVVPHHVVIGTAQGLALLVTLNALSMLIGYLDGEHDLYAIATPSGVAVHTAVAFVLLGIGVLCARPRSALLRLVSGPEEGSRLFRLLLPAAVLLPLLIGVLTLRSQQAGLFGFDFGVVLLTFANLLVFWWLARALNLSTAATRREAVQSRMLLDLAECRMARLESLRLIDQAIIQQPHALGALLDLLLDQVQGQLGVDAVAVLLVLPGHDTLVYARWTGFQTAPNNLPADSDPSYVGQALARRRVMTGPEPDPGGLSLAPAPPHAAHEGFVVGYAAPLIVEGQITGVLELGHRAPLTLDAEAVAFFETLAGQTAIALATFRLFTDLERANEALVQAYDETLAGWSYALELRDGETRGHTQRVTNLTLRLAAAFGLSDEDLIHVRRGAMLHDIGKLGVPDAVLLKPDRLTDAEWQMMRRHPVYAYEWLRPIAYLYPALAIPYCHHEHWDGSGYPRGLRGEAIPLEARIFIILIS